MVIKKKYPQLNTVQGVSYFGKFNPKWNVFLKPLFSKKKVLNTEYDGYTHRLIETETEC